MKTVEFPTETHGNILVARCDTIPKKPLPPYLKMVELEPFIKYLSKKNPKPKVVGYYSVPESDWTWAIPVLCEKYGMKGLVGYFERKKVPNPDFINRCGENVYWMKPNIYQINYGIMKKHVESLEGFMVPMGVEHPFVVKAFEEFLDRIKLPDVGTYIIPAGSGVMLAGFLRKIKRSVRVIAVCTRPVASVKKVVWRFTPQSTVEYHYHVDDNFKMPWRGHRHWESSAYSWLQKNPIKDKLCFFNLG